MPTKKEILEMEWRTFRNAFTNVFKQFHDVAQETWYLPYIFLWMGTVAGVYLMLPTTVESPTPIPTCLATPAPKCPEASITIEYRKCELEKTGATIE